MIYGLEKFKSRHAAHRFKLDKIKYTFIFDKVYIKLGNTGYTCFYFHKFTLFIVSK
jgi:hypothetical protein